MESSVEGITVEVVRKRLANEVWEQMVERVNHCCLKCGAKAYPMSQDHVFPVSMGGDNSEDNIQPLCLACNQRKGDRGVEDYRPADWPWKVKVGALEAVVVKPSNQFLADVERVRVFMYEWRKLFPGKTFISGSDPHIRWIETGGAVYGECGACPGYEGMLTQAQVDKSVDNFISEAHVAWHLAKGMVEMCARLECEAVKLYLPEKKA